MSKINSRVEEKERKEELAIENAREKVNRDLKQLLLLSERVCDIIDTANYSLFREGWDSPIVKLGQPSSYTPMYGLQLMFEGCRRDGFKPNVKFVGVRVKGFNIKLYVDAEKVFFYNEDYYIKITLCENGEILPISDFNLPIPFSAIKDFVNGFDEFESRFYELING